MWYVLVIGLFLRFCIMSLTDSNTSINVTNILYQYSLLCGPAFFDDEANIWNFPDISTDYNICPICSRNKHCFAYDNCCPDLEFKFPLTNCVSEIIYSSNNTLFVENKYEIISTCPKGSNINISLQCTKSRSIQEKVQYPPVTSRKYLVSFHNEFCALCNDIKQFIPWKLNISCDIKFDVFADVDEIVTKAVEKECTIFHVPADILSDMVKPCRNRHLINKCNVTGTWRQENRDIDHACKTLKNPFPPYKNVFCYMCNPPELQATDSIGSCNMTGLWTEYDSDVEIACRNGRYSLITHPYKNIYCYLCNIEFFEIVQNKNSFSVEVSPNNSLTYYIYNFMETKQISCKRYYRKWKYRVDCRFPIALSRLNNNISNLILFLGEAEDCSIETNQNIKYDICMNGNCTDINKLQIDWACETESLEIYIKGADHGISSWFPNCGQHLSEMKVFDNNNSIDITTNSNSEECQWFNCNDNQLVYPLKYFFCNCCSIDYHQPFEEIQLSSSSWNIFSWSFYTKTCRQNEILDTVQDKCRRLDCFTGKHLIEQECKPLLSGYMYSVPIGYTLPVVFSHRDDSSHIIPRNISNFLQDEISIKTNLSSVICMESGNNYSTESFYSHVDVYPVMYSTEIEMKLICFTSELHKSHDEYLNIDYDHRSILHIDNSLNTNDCGKTRRPLVSKLLVCSNVLFLNSEYRRSSDNNDILLTQYDTTFKFYQYHIDSQNNMRLCKDDFMVMINQKKSLRFVYYVIMITCTVVSTLCLFLTLVTYFLFSTLRTLPGKNILNLVISLLLYHIFYLVLMTYDGDDITACQIIGILVHYFLLSTFGCFTVCTIHMFKVFGRSKLIATVEASHTNYLLQIYLVCIYGYSALLVAGNVIVTYVTSEGMSYGYGRDGKCFLSHSEGFVATVMTPIIITFGINIILYSVTIYNLKKKTSSNAAITGGSRVNKQQLSIFIKLFVTTGCSWMLLIINVFVDKMLIYVIIAGLNSLQGLYVFIAYMCNKRVYRMYTNKFCGVRQLGSGKTKSTSMNTLSRQCGKSKRGDIGFGEKNLSENKL